MDKNRFLSFSLSLACNPTRANSFIAFNWVSSSDVRRTNAASSFVSGIEAPEESTFGASEVDDDRATTFPKPISSEGRS